MPVVNQDARDPASWWKAGVSYGVIKDGTQLRFCRVARAGKSESFVCEIDAWQQAPAFRQRMEKEQAAGAVLFAGLEPHRVMLRRLESPLRDRAKSDEIWGTLLDAALPFPLEKCQVCFLPAESMDSQGRSCLAVAARLEDLKEAMAEWQDLGLTPDALLPEQLMISRDRESSRWLGETRSVFVVWQKGSFLGGGGSLTPAQREIGFARFRQSLPDPESLTLRECGPDAGASHDDLEQALAMAARRPHPLHANLLAHDLGSPALQKRYAKKQQTLKVSLMLLLLMLFLFPLTLRHQLRATQNLLRNDIATAYEELTGSPSNAPGQEMLLARRFMEEQWGPLHRAVSDLSQPAVANTLVEMIRSASEAGLVFSDLEMRPTQLNFHLLGEEAKVETFCNHLRVSGWKVQRLAENNGTWRISGEWLQ